jgi:hypothetical protein
MKGIQMTTPAVSSAAFLPGVISNESKVPARRTYRTTTSFVAVHFDETGKGRIVFLPSGATLHLIGRSSCLPVGLEVEFEHTHYNVFEIDILVRATPICESIRAKRGAFAA